MIAAKPTILIYANDPDPACLRALCAGAEEEGVLFAVQLRPQADAALLADEAAAASVLGSGLGLCGDTAALQLRGMPPGRPVFLLSPADAAACRALGADSARAIKKLPFKTQRGQNR